MVRLARKPRQDPRRQAAAGGSRAGARPGPADRVLALQRTAGNAAVARALLARQPGTASPLALPGLGLGGPILPEPIPAHVESAVRAWLEMRRIGIGISVQQGATSMPEVVAQIRAAVPAAREIAPYEVEMLVRDVMGRETPPATRGRPSAGSAESEIAARIANALPRPPTSIKLSSSAGKLELSLDGLEASTKYGSAKVTAKAGKDEAEASISGAGAKVTATGSYKGDAFGLKTEVRGVSFAAKVQRENDAWSKWSMKLTVPVLGPAVSARPPAAELTEAVQKANAAVATVVAHLHAGGSPTDDVVKKALADIKPAFEAVSKATAAPKGPAVTVGVGVQGGAGTWSAGVSLVIEF